MKYSFYKNNILALNDALGLLYQSNPNKCKGVVNIYKTIGDQKVNYVSAIYLLYPLLAKIYDPLDGIINAHNTVDTSL